MESRSRFAALPAGILFTLALGTAVTLVAARASSAQEAGRTRPAVFDEEGHLLRPRGYRRWVFAGAPLTPNDMNSGKAAFPEFHSVYIDPESYDAYKRDGKWRDGTVLVKELSSVGSKSSTSGKGYFMGEFTGLEAVVKSAERFADEPGNWGFFRFTDEEGGPVRKTAQVLPTASCAACHQATADDDLIFTQHYPVLREARRFGRGEPEDS